MLTWRYQEPLREIWMNMKEKIILTAPKTEMSEHHEREFLGFGACTPVSVLPRKLIEIFFYPKVKVSNDGVVEAAPYGLRKIEAVLRNNGFDVLTIHPDYIGKYLDDAKVLGISAMDPLGYGPASATFSLFFGELFDAATAYEFKRLMLSKEVRRFRELGGKIIVGGAGSWQIAFAGMQDELGIDTIVIGEAEEIAVDIFKRAMEGGELPRIVEAESPSLESIPTIQAPSINGLVEISRGCGRGCKFCSVALRKRRDFPIDHIISEVKVNVDGGRRNVILHAEDVLLYGSKDLIPNRAKVIELYKKVSNLPGVNEAGASHMAFSSVVADPKLIQELSEVLELGTDKCKWMGVQMGIETGSSRLIEKYMAGKAYPFKPDNWPDIVVEGYKILAENNIVPACTLIVGLPGEDEDDIIRTVELVDRIFEYPGYVVPLVFIPMHGIPLEKYKMITKEILTKAHYDLLMRCMEYNIKWTNRLFRDYTEGMGYKKLFVKALLWLFVKSVEMRLKRSKLYKEILMYRRQKAVTA